MADDNSKIAKNLESLAQLMTTFSKVIVEQTKATQEQTAAFREQSRKLDEILDLRRRTKALEEAAHEKEVEDGKRWAKIDLIAKIFWPVAATAAGGAGLAVLDLISKAP